MWAGRGTGHLRLAKTSIAEYKSASRILGYQAAPRNSPIAGTAAHDPGRADPVPPTPLVTRHPPPSATRPVFRRLGRRGHQESRQAEFPRPESRGWSFVTRSTRPQDLRAGSLHGRSGRRRGPELSKLFPELFFTGALERLIISASAFARDIESETRALGVQRSISPPGPVTATSTSTRSPPRNCWSASTVRPYRHVASSDRPSSNGSWPAFRSWISTIEAPRAGPTKRTPSPRIAGLGAINDDLIAPAVDAEDWEALH